MKYPKVNRIEPITELFKVDIFGNSISCIFSKCMKYRYVYAKEWDATKPKVAFIGLNPSIANPEKPDNTIVKVSKIAKNNGFGGFYMLNLFGLISPYPEDLLISVDPFKDNHHWRTKYIERAQSIVFCWGTFKQAKPVAKVLIELYPNAKTLFITKDGSPKHPLYCKDNTTLIPFNASTETN